MSETELFAEHKAELPEEWHDTFDELVGRGRAPSSVKATIEYITTEKTQRQICDEFGVSRPPLKQLRGIVAKLGPVDSCREALHSRDHQTTEEYCERVATHLDWTEGVQYRFRQKEGHDHPIMLKAGWRALAEHLLENDE